MQVKYCDVNQSLQLLFGSSPSLNVPKIESRMSRQFYVQLQQYFLVHLMLAQHKSPFPQWVLEV